MLKRYFLTPLLTLLASFAVHPNLYKEAPSLIGAVVEVDAIVIGLPALGQEGAILKHPVELYDGGE
jgi:hypothetical protein